MLSVIFLILGFILIIKGGDLFVDSSIEIARILKVPQAMIGATLVSIGTTAPELTVSSYASLIGNSGIAIGNAVGSAIANIGLIIGCVGFIQVIQINVSDFRKRVPWMLGLVLLLVLFAWNLNVSRGQGLILVGIVAVYLFMDYLSLRSSKRRPDIVDSHAVEKGDSIGKIIGVFVVGLIMVIVGSRLLVDGGVAIAEMLGISSVVIGLTVIAIGTSLPELVTGITAAKKGAPEIAVGNIVGANVLNIGLIVGVSAMINPLSLNTFTRNYSFGFLALFSMLLFAAFAPKGRAGKRVAFLSLLLYGLYIAGLVVISS